jgi:glycosyltransferase involved in cell wall biosynthesis
MKKYNIGIFHYIANYTDGVSLEMNKWRNVFEDMGHTTYLCAGKFGSQDEVVIEEMYHHSPEARLLSFNTFKGLKDYPDEMTYRNELFGLARRIEVKLKQFIEENNINFLVPQNVWSVASNPAVAIALTNIMRMYRLPALAHNHDFYFERIDGHALTCSTAAEIADRFLPPRDALANHVVINSLARDKLFERKGIRSSIVPNVFDFSTSDWILDDFNRDFRKRIGLKHNDLMILQAARLVTRKGIELAIDFMQALNSPHRRAQLASSGLFDGRQFPDENRIVFVLAGYAQEDVTGRYKNLLARKAHDLNVEALFIEDLIGERREIRNGKKIYSLWDTYVFADLVTYPSQWEGWGNQLLEAVRAKLPIMLFEYPVYLADIKEKGLRVISLGDQITGKDQHGLVTIDSDIIQSAADQAVAQLTNPDLRRSTVEHNFQIGKRYFSMDALYVYLEQSMRSFDIGQRSE